MIKKDERDSLMSSHMLGTQRWLTPFKKNKGSVFSCLTFSSKLQPKHIKLFVFVVDTRYYTICKRMSISVKTLKSKRKWDGSANYI